MRFPRKSRNPKPSPNGHRGAAGRPAAPRTRRDSLKSTPPGFRRIRQTDCHRLYPRIACRTPRPGGLHRPRQTRLASTTCLSAPVPAWTPIGASSARPDPRPRRRAALGPFDKIFFAGVACVCCSPTNGSDDNKPETETSAGEPGKRASPPKSNGKTERFGLARRCGGHRGNGPAQRKQCRTHNPAHYNRNGSRKARGAIPSVHRGAHAHDHNQCLKRRVLEPRRTLGRQAELKAPGGTESLPQSRVSANQR